MNMFNRKPVVGPEITGTQALLQHLQTRTGGPSGTPLARIAADVSDAINDANNKAKAREIARNMAPDADDVAIRAIANRLLDGIGTNAAVLSGQVLEEFTKGKINLPPEVKNALAMHLYGGGVIFDPERDKLRSAYNHVPQKMGPPPDAWSHPDPTIRAAQEQLKAVMAAARGPMPLMPSPASPPSTPKLRPGFI
ncbi:hypothetical protein [Bradyrhizobium sp. CSS354]|uniref:hypothetical protein n=1 Tax=Bradyrhizobium sp. CSS354 TaxID=2699172 RepID=UPI0023B1A2C8|nr:hypothetical protein [Bradyrhizobium sp. CSS354]MDE5462230.1 hypothetical protein [Bradyrhizobium sp. CSS354]